jgi:hypothetical protein
MIIRPSRNAAIAASMEAKGEGCVGGSGVRFVEGMLVAGVQILLRLNLVQTITPPLYRTACEFGEGE